MSEVRGIFPYGAMFLLCPNIGNEMVGLGRRVVIGAVVVVGGCVVGISVSTSWPL